MRGIRAVAAAAWRRMSYRSNRRPQRGRAPGRAGTAAHTDAGWLRPPPFRPRSQRADDGNFGCPCLRRHPLFPDQLIAIFGCWHRCVQRLGANAHLFRPALCLRPPKLAPCLDWAAPGQRRGWPATTPAGRKTAAGDDTGGREACGAPPALRAHPQPWRGRSNTGPLYGAPRCSSA
jgi:hypothetical protein